MMRLVRGARLSAVGVVVVVCGGYPAPLLALEPIQLTSGRSEVSVSERLEYLEDPSGSFTFDQVSSAAWRPRYSPVNDDKANFGFTDSVYWFHFAVVDHAPEHDRWLLEIGYPVLDEVRAYIQRVDGSYSETVVGDSLPFGAREFDHRHFVMTVRVGQGAVHHVYLRVSTASSMLVPLTLWTPKAFADSTSRTELGYGLFYGVGLVMILYNLFLLLVTRDTSYLWFCAFASCYLPLQAGLDGTLYQHVWSNYPGLNNVALPLTAALSAATGLMFARRFTNFSVTHPRADRATLGLVAISAVLAVVAVIARYHLAITLAAVNAAVCSLVMAAIGVTALRGGFRAARFFVLAWVVFLAFSVAMVLTKFGVLPALWVADLGPKLGFVSDIVLLSLALADRINLMKSETEQAQRRALDIQRRATETLEAEVGLQTKELRAQAVQLRAQDEQKTRFFQNVSHELRTPLTLILTPLEQLAEREELAGDPRLELATRNANRLLRLVNELLDFQKLAAGKKQMRFSPIDLARFLESCSEYVVEPCRKRKIDFRLRRVIGEQVVVRAEADALEKIVFNYLSNAMKHTPAGGRIELSLLTDHDSSPPRARIEVSDSGPGIAPGDQARLFQVFSQVDDELSARGEGTGLGLALVRELSHALGGEVGVESMLGKGSRFWVELPLVSSDTATPVRAAFAFARGRLKEVASEASALLNSSETLEPTGPAEGELILVADDLADMRVLIRQLLERSGYRTAAAVDGPSLLEAASRYRPRAIVTDWMMPGMTGPEVIAKLRADDTLSSTPVVLLTAKSDEESRVLGTTRGADAFLGKPFNEQELLSTLRNLLQLKAHERKVEELNHNLCLERDALARTQDEKAELTRFIVHDLKNPLTIIIGNLDTLLADSALVEDDRESVASSLVAAQSLNRMVMDLLDVGRSEDGALVLNKSEVIVSELFDELQVRMQRWLTRTGHQLTCSAALPRLYADRDLVLRVLENLIDNAAKYSPPGGGIELETAGDGEHAMIYVRDHGIGIPADQRERIFQKYHRVPGSNGAVTRASRGLGLVFCRLTAEAHGGAIWVEENQPSGCRFCLRLPHSDS